MLLQKLELETSRLVPQPSNDGAVLSCRDMLTHPLCVVVRAKTVGNIVQHDYCSAHLWLAAMRIRQKRC
jgi:hypothetical protein